MAHCDSTALADSTEQEIKELHIDMVIRLSKHFKPSLEEHWEELLERLSLFLEPAELAQTSFMKICKTLMDNEIIDYGKYSKLYKVIHAINVQAAKIIKETTDKIIALRSEGRSEANLPTSTGFEKTDTDSSTLTPMIETTEAVIFEERKEYNFFQGKSFQVAKEKLLKNRLVIIKGNSGDGKTSMALELLRLLCCDGIEGQKPRRPLQLHDIKDFDSVTPKSQLVIYVDDIFGKNVVCKQDVDEWEKREKDILSKFGGEEQTEGNVLVITIRSEILNSLKGSCLEKFFSKENIVDVNLDENEKLELLRLYSPKENFDSWTEKEEKDITACAPDLGFPQCCRLFRDTTSLHTERIHFFERPFQFLKSCLSKLEDGKFYGLMYLFLNGGKVMEDDLDSHNDNLEQSAVLEAAFADDVVKVTSQGEPPYKMAKGRQIVFVKDSFDCLLGWLVKKESNQEQNVCYKFNHDSIEETVALLYGDKTPIGFIRNCPRKFLSYLTTSKTSLNKIIISSDSQKNAMYKRSVREFESIYKTHMPYHNYVDITSLDVWTDVQFLQGFIRWLSGEDVDKMLCHKIKTVMLNEACSSGSEDFALLLLSEGAKPDNKTPLHVARKGWVNVMEKILRYVSDEIKPRSLNVSCNSSSEDCALFLLSKGVEPDQNTPFCVVKGGCKNVLCKILEYDVTPTARAFRSVSTHPGKCMFINVLHEACLFERKEMVAILCNRYPHLLHDTEKTGQSTLHLVALTGNYDLFQTVETVLLKSLFKVEDEQHKCETVKGRVVHRRCVCAQYICQLVDDDGSTVLHGSCSSGYGDICKYLCESFPALTTVVNNEGETALHRSCFGENGGICKYLCESFPALTTVVSNDGKTALHYSCHWENRDICKYLCESFPALITIVSNTGATALHYSCYLGNKDVCKYLCESFPALTTVVSNAGETALHFSCYLRNKDVCKYLCESFPALPTVVSTTGATALHYSCHLGNKDVCKYLCESFPALTTAVTNEGETALHYSCYGGNKYVCKYLCESFPALTTGVTNEGETALHYSCYGGNKYVCKYLCESFPALTTAVNNNGDTVLHTSCCVGNRDVFNYLCESLPALIPFVNNDGETVLHACCNKGNRHGIGDLCESYPALTTVLSNNGRHCLHYLANSCEADVDMFAECEAYVKHYAESTGRKYDIKKILDNEGKSVLNLVKEQAERRAQWGADDPLYDHIVRLFAQEKQ